MNYLQKGGTISINTQKFKELVEESALSLRDTDKFDLEYLNFSSVGGYVFKLKSRKLDNFKTIFGGSPTIVSNGCEIILKVIQIKDNGKLNSLENSINGKEISNITTVEREIKTQQSIWCSSLDFNYEPICPQIVHYKFCKKNQPFLLKFLNAIKNSVHKTTLVTILNNYIGYIINRTGIAKEKLENEVITFGFIFMEFMTDSKPVSKIFENRYMEKIQRSPHFITKNELLENEKNVLNNYLYTIIRLYKLGYAHGDLHLDNAMYYSNYDYLNNYRVFLIDFGRTYKISDSPQYRTNYVSSDLLLDKNQLSDAAGNLWWSYKQMYNFILEKKTKYSGSLEDYYNNTKGYIKETSLKKFMNKIMFDLNLKDTIRDAYLLFDQIFAYENIVNNNYFKNKLNLINIDNINLNEALINVNVSEKCFAMRSPDGTIMYPSSVYSNYNLKLIEDNKKNNLLQYFTPKELIGKIQNIVPSGQPRIFLWMIGKGNFGMGLYMIETKNCFELTSKHIILAYYAGITSFYGAGELSIYNKVVNVNLASGTYTLASMRNGKINPEQYEYLKSASVRFIRKTFNKGLSQSNEYTVQFFDSVPTLINQQNCNYPNYSLYQYNNLLQMQNLYKQNYLGKDLITVTTDKNLCMSDHNGGGALTNDKSDLILNSSFESKPKNMYEIQIGKKEKKESFEIDIKNKSEYLLDDLKLAEKFNLNTIEETVPLIYKDENGNDVNILEEMKKNELLKNNLTCLCNLMFQKKIEATDLKIDVDTNSKTNYETMTDKISEKINQKNKQINYTKNMREPTITLENNNLIAQEVFGGFNKSKKYYTNKKQKIKTIKRKRHNNKRKGKKITKKYKHKK